MLYALHAIFSSSYSLQTWSIHLFEFGLYLFSFSFFIYFYFYFFFFNYNKHFAGRLLLPCYYFSFFIIIVSQQRARVKLHWKNCLMYLIHCIFNKVLLIVLRCPFIYSYVFLMYLSVGWKTLSAVHAKSPSESEGRPLYICQFFIVSFLFWQKINASSI